MAPSANTSTWGAPLEAQQKKPKAKANRWVSPLHAGEDTIRDEKMEHTTCATEHETTRRDNAGRATAMAST